MAKSPWKYYTIKNKDIDFYLDEYMLPGKYFGKQHYGFVKNNFRITNLNYMHKYVAYMGQYLIRKKFYQWNVGNKVWEFLKFTKPFNFRSKKKKKK